jgi:hypothetical protein
MKNCIHFYVQEQSQPYSVQSTYMFIQHVHTGHTDTHTHTHSLIHTKSCHARLQHCYWDIAKTHLEHQNSIFSIWATGHHMRSQCEKGKI